MKYNNFYYKYIGVNMILIKHINRLGIILALVLIFWGISPFIVESHITNDILATSIILILIGVGYIISVIKPQFNKAILFFEGIIIAFSGLLLDAPYNFLFYIIGIIVLIIAILAYIQKLPKFLLKFFYR